MKGTWTNAGSFVMLTLIVVVIGLASCSNGSTELRHAHVPGAKATCAAPQTCTVCGEILSSALGHNWDWVTYESGDGARKCQRTNGCTSKAGIGDIGPKGGIIFYAAEYDFYIGTTVGDNTTKPRYYLEAAPDTISKQGWATKVVTIPGLSSNNDYSDWGIGMGKKNTALIIANGFDNKYDTPAASACRDLGDDWFLPSKEELDMVYAARDVLSIPETESSGDVPFRIWSSSQWYDQGAYYVYFDSGIEDIYAKDIPINVHAVRAF